MPGSDSPDSTLPSLQAALPGARVAPALLLTIVFHPDRSRIGQSARLGEGRTLLGRERVAFARPGSQGASPLGERHVSRRALRLDFDGDSLLVSREPGSCRCRLGGQELLGFRELSREELLAGVSLLLSHSVLLCISLCVEPLPGESCPDFGLVGSSRYTRSLREQVEQAARCDLDVLLLGATGTGKEVVARAIHAHSARGDRPLVSVNVAAIPASLAPAALFGAARGAFTGADRARQGYFQQAAGSTLFLDEIGDAPEELQPQLLRALQQREVQVVGGPVQALDLRVISATDADLDDSGAGFRSALRHRLGAFEIRLKPLAQHREDLGELLDHFLAEAFALHGRQRLLPGPDSSPGDVAAWAGLYHACLRYDWPGNVRQIINICAQVALASRTGLVVPPAVYRLLAPLDGGQAGETVPGTAQGESVSRRLRRIMDITEEEFERAWHDNIHEVRTVARSLGVSRQSVYRKVATSDRYRLASEVPESELAAAMQACDGDTLATALHLQVSPSGLRARLRQGGSAPRA